MNTTDKVDVLYVIGTGSVNDNNELRYSLRTLERNCPFINRVIISGDVPSFIGGDAVVVRCEDVSPEGKHWNMLHKIVAGILEANIDKPFWFSCDDHFMTRQVCRDADFKIVNRGRIYTESDWERDNNRRCNKYQRAFASTGHVLRNLGFPDFNTVWHGNMVIHPSVLDKVLAACEECRRRPGSTYGPEPMLLFNNIYLKDGERDFKYVNHDVKAKSFNSCMRFSLQDGVFSTGDSAWNDGRLLAWFKENYREKSRWER